jgi:hypothetical protein
MAKSPGGGSGPKKVGAKKGWEGEHGMAVGRVDRKQKTAGVALAVHFEVP